MKAGGGKEKGSRFERDVGTDLSLWISKGGRADLFARNVLSGGQFTNQTKKGSLETGTPGDLMANHPLAFSFLSMFFIECKHYADLGFEALLFDEDKSFLGRVMAKCKEQAHQATPEVFPIIVAKQNRRPSIIICDGEVGQTMLKSANRVAMRPSHHFLHNGTMMMMPLDQMTMKVNASLFIANAKMLREAVL